MTEADDRVRAQILGAIDERTKNIEKNLDSSVLRIEARLDEMGKTFVTKSAFSTVRAVVFGMVAIILTVTMYLILASAIGHNVFPTHVPSSSSAPAATP